MYVRVTSSSVNYPIYWRNNGLTQQERHESISFNPITHGKRSRRDSFLADNRCCLRGVRPDTVDARIDAHRPAIDRLGPEWRIPLYEL